MIKFSWNKKHGEEIEDSNLEFRNLVIEYLLSELPSTPGILIRDLLLAEAYLSRELWGTTQYLADLGSLLLEQTHTQYLDSFFEAKHQSFDTDCELNPSLLSNKALNLIIETLRESSEPGIDKEKTESYLNYFEAYL